MKIIKLEEVDSTNEYCKRLTDGVDVAVTAKRQTAGKGTKGRSFSSQDGGLYISVMRHYKNFPASETFFVLVNSCVAVCKTFEHFKINPQIRWANDVLADGKKICGTLIENIFSGDKLNRSIVGMGINVNNALPAELSGIATSMSMLTGKIFDVDAVRDELIENLNKHFTVNDYKEYTGWLGGKVTVKTLEGMFSATALDIGADGRLILEADGRLIKLSSAEVSLRF